MKPTQNVKKKSADNELSHQRNSKNGNRRLAVSWNFAKWKDCRQKQAGLELTVSRSLTGFEHMILKL